MVSNLELEYKKYIRNQRIFADYKKDEENSRWIWFYNEVGELVYFKKVSGYVVEHDIVTNEQETLNWLKLNKLIL